MKDFLTDSQNLAEARLKPFAHGKWVHADKVRAAFAPYGKWGQEQLQRLDRMTTKNDGLSNFVFPYDMAKRVLSECHYVHEKKKREAEEAAKMGGLVFTVF